MVFLIGADIMIQAERKKLDLDAWLCAHPDDEIKMAAITVAELWRSAEPVTGPHGAKRQKFLTRFLEVIEVVSYSEKAAVQHAQLSTVLESTGQRIAVQDLILAATALESGATLVTFNTRRFAAIPGLTVIAP